VGRLLARDARRWRLAEVGQWSGIGGGPDIRGRPPRRSWPEAT